MACCRPVTHVIFDMDGLIFDTEKVYTQMTQAVAGRYGKTFTWDMKVKAMGKVAMESAKIMVEEMDLPLTPEEYESAISELSEEYFLHTEVLPGVEKLVYHLHEHKVPIAIATSSKQHTYEIKTKNHQELISKFHHVVCGSTDPEVVNGKPAPDIFLVCANRFPDNPLPEKVLVFEDAPNGVEAAAAAGMQVVMVPDPRMDSKLRENATLVLTSLENFQPELFGLPPY
ncbi:pseudouridine-5'-phosphatase-like [Uloborus diversus]|uniref:pseudouridine-5'-phosphatase-like n=1 Tax=Uloborus diversus TaxID=327109 RepID=UPI00240A3E86|nr:pseudouridine-5'-phosphatase-like [Uloborus diversus]